MRILIRRAGPILLGCCALLSAQTPAIDGAWQGSLETPGGNLRVVFHVEKSPGGSWTAKLDSPDQGAYGLPVDSVSFDGETFKAEMKALGAAYEGTLAADGNSMTGKFSQAGMGLALTLARLAQEPAGPNRPQTPKKPYPYKEEEVAIPNPAAPGVTLAGTLTLPPGPGPHPAVILITGSGPQDRDETIFAHKPFLVLADALTRQGIAVLRYDDRGTAKSTGNFGAATSEDFATDAAAALDFLQARGEIARGKIGLCGHSEGGIIAPMIAAKRPGIAFLVLLAGTAVTGEQVMYEQAAAMITAAGQPAAARANRELQQKLFDIIRKEKDPAAAEPKLKEALAGVPGADARVRQTNGPWLRFFAFYDPAPALEKIKIPVLALNGEKDLQVLPNQNVPAMEAALKKAGNKDYTVQRVAGLNHLFQTATTGSITEYGKIEETMSPAVLETIASWIRRHTGLDKAIPGVSK